MPSTYTGSGIELIGDGEQSGSWGTTTNTNLQILNRLVSEAGTIALSGTTHTLTISDGTLSDGQYAVLVFGGSPSGTNTVTISPNDAKRVFIVSNTSGQSVVLTQGSGGDVTVPNNGKAIVYSDGGGASAAVVDVTPVTPTLAAIGLLTPTDGTFIVGNGSTWVAESGNTVLQSIGVTATATELNVLDGITATTSALNTASTHYVPSGGIIMWSGSIASIPSGWFLCNGSNGTPDLRNRFIVGAGDAYAVAATGGADSVTLTEAQMPAHTHTGSTNSAGDHNHTAAIRDAWQGNTVDNNGGGFMYVGQNNTNTYTTSTAGAHTHTVTVGSTGGGTSHENRPPYYALAYIMKA